MQTPRDGGWRMRLGEQGTSERRCHRKATREMQTPRTVVARCEEQVAAARGRQALEASFSRRATLARLAQTRSSSPLFPSLARNADQRVSD